ncbi:MAG: hypothetical protein QOI81_614 [Actinomycetota bacterium]|nr:hypothetical protein [Actinomycetota bacterium]
MSAPTTRQISDRALILYALIRRGTIEYALREFEYEQHRVEQAEVARHETDRWLEREELLPALTDADRVLFDAVSGAWPPQAIADGMWRKESLATLLWALEHLADLPSFGEEVDSQVLDDAITRYGEVPSFRSNGSVRPADQIEAAWLEADAWFGATEGRDGEDATVASIAAERFRALSWLRDASAAPA